ncbi:MAG: hypothetical protein RLZ35_422 [Pseudomonadota bacterium]|jgi:hypothetical protein
MAAIFPSTREGKKPRSGLRARGARDSRVVSRSDYETRRQVIVGRNGLSLSCKERRVNHPFLDAGRIAQN